MFTTVFHIEVQGAKCRDAKNCFPRTCKKHFKNSPIFFTKSVPFLRHLSILTRSFIVCLRCWNTPIFGSLDDFGVWAEADVVYLIFKLPSNLAQYTTVKVMAYHSNCQLLWADLISLTKVLVTEFSHDILWHFITLYEFGWSYCEVSP